jgi:hypothetical protein
VACAYLEAVFMRMKHGICNLSVVPVRAEASDVSEMVNQLLFGELYTVLEHQKKWLRIRADYDNYEGWIDRKQHCALSPADHEKFSAARRHMLLDTAQMADFGTHDQHLVLLLGSSFYNKANQQFDWISDKLSCAGHTITGQQDKSKLVDFAVSYLNAPYLWGGKTPFGIDCSGFSQMVYKLGGRQIPRDAKDQAMLGEPLSFIDEAEPGDLAFFDNKEGIITHVGVLLADNFIIHASGKVRFDRLDQHGIYNAETREHTHRLRVIKKIF